MRVLFARRFLLCTFLRVWIVESVLSVLMVCYFVVLFCCATFIVLPLLLVWFCLVRVDSLLC